MRTLIAFSQAAQLLPGYVSELIEGAKKGESAARKVFRNPTITALPEKDVICFYDACEWIDEMFLKGAKKPNVKRN